jgi:hypothetical protein
MSAVSAAATAVFGDGRILPLVPAQKRIQAAQIGKRSRPRSSRSRRPAAAAKLALFDWIEAPFVLSKGTSALPGRVRLWPYQRAIGRIPAVAVAGGTQPPPVLEPLVLLRCPPRCPRHGPQSLADGFTVRHPLAGPPATAQARSTARSGPMAAISLSGALSSGLKFQGSTMSQGQLFRLRQDQP